MKRTLSAPVLLAALALIGLYPAQSFGWGLFRHCGSCCSPACEAPPPKMKEVQVTCYKPVWKEKEVTEVVCRMVPKQEKCTYTVMVPKFQDVTKKVTVMECRTKEVETTCTVLVPKVYPEKRTVSYCDWETKTVTEKVPVCRLVPVKCVDSCGRCCTKWERVTEIHEVTRCVRTPIHKTKEIVVNVVKCEPETRKVKKMVCESVPVTKEVTCRVCTYEKEERVGVRCTYECQKDTVKRTVKYCEMQPYTKTIQVPECQPVSCGHRHHCGIFGLFRRCCD